MLTKLIAWYHCLGDFECIAVLFVFFVAAYILASVIGIRLSMRHADHEIGVGKLSKQEREKL